jgi:DNA-binding transcriptional regulator YhcF (GntR family)
MDLTLRIDRALNVPVTSQLRGQIEYGIAFGDIVPGARLPSVRELAEHLGIAPVTVSQVYRELQDKDLLETRVGRGTFVRQDAPRPARPDQQSYVLDELVHRLSRTATEIGLTPRELADIIAVRLGRLEQGRGLRGIFVGNFVTATRRYVHTIAGYLRPHDRLEPVILSDLESSPAARDEVATCDVVLTLAYRAVELRSLLGPDTPIMTIAFVPSTGASIKPQGPPAVPATAGGASRRPAYRPRQPPRLVAGR